MVFRGSKFPEKQNVLNFNCRTQTHSHFFGGKSVHAGQFPARQVQEIRKSSDNISESKQKKFEQLKISSAYQ
jgi:hypothetical protein